MSRKKTTRKRLPAAKISARQQALFDAMTLRRWIKQVEGSLKLLNQLKDTKTPDMPKWQSGTRDYYLKQLTKLLDNYPEGGEGFTAKYRHILDQL